MNDEPYRGTVIVIPDPEPEFIENPLLLVLTVWVFGMALFGCAMELA